MFSAPAACVRPAPACVPGMQVVVGNTGMKRKGDGWR